MHWKPTCASTSQTTTQNKPNSSKFVKHVDVTSLKWQLRSSRKKKRIGLFKLY